MPNQASNSSSSSINARSVVPIPASIQHIRGYPKKLIIFRVHASPFWWCRCFYNGKHYKRSTKTELKPQAIQFAKRFFVELVSDRVEPICRVKRHPTMFVALAKAVLKEDALKVERGELSRRYLVCQQQRLGGLLLDAFGSLDIREIDYERMDQFRTDLFRRGLSNSTIQLYMASLNKVFTLAQRLGILTAAPIKPKIKQVDNARGHFELDEYRQLCKTSRRLLSTSHSIRQLNDGVKTAGQSLRRVIITPELVYMIPFMVYTFIRPTDLKNIKHRHLEIRSGPRGEYLHMAIPESKRHDKPITSMPRAASVYKKLWRYQEARGFGGNDDYIFQPEQNNRQTAYRVLTRQFDVVLTDTQLRKGRDGSQRTLYSLRHTAIMYRLIYGGEINLLSLARNARTSVAMIERFYASQLESSKLTKELHAKKPL